MPAGFAAVPAKPAPEAAAKPSSLRRSIGVHRILFITTVFAIMAVFLLLFTSGRMHAQHAMHRASISVVPTFPVALTDSLEGGQAPYHHRMPASALPSAEATVQAALHVCTQ